MKANDGKAGASQSLVRVNFHDDCVAGRLFFSHHPRFHSYPPPWEASFSKWRKDAERNNPLHFCRKGDQHQPEERAELVWWRFSLLWKDLQSSPEAQTLCRLWQVPLVADWGGNQSDQLTGTGVGLRARERGENTGGTKAEGSNSPNAFLMWPLRTDSEPAAKSELLFCGLILPFCICDLIME